MNTKSRVVNIGDHKITITRVPSGFDIRFIDPVTNQPDATGGGISTVIQSLSNALHLNGMEESDLKEILVGFR